VVIGRHLLVETRKGKFENCAKEGADLVERQGKPEGGFEGREKNRVENFRRKFRPWVIAGNRVRDEKHNHPNCARREYREAMAE